MPPSPSFGSDSSTPIGSDMLVRFSSAAVLSRFCFVLVDICIFSLPLSLSISLLMNILLSQSLFSRYFYLSFSLSIYLSLSLLRFSEGIDLSVYRIFSPLHLVRPRSTKANIPGAVQRGRRHNPTTAIKQITDQSVILGTICTHSIFGSGNPNTSNLGLNLP